MLQVHNRGRIAGHRQHRAGRSFLQFQGACDARHLDAGNLMPAEHEVRIRKTCARQRCPGMTQRVVAGGAGSSTPRKN